ncbi:MAG: metallophosphatase [Armatimonadetes bacterium]|nr:metallophosphatase [Armatimonadota bacterium]
MARVTIFHTSDMHNKLNPAGAESLRDLKFANPGSLMFDSGDAIWAGNIYWRPGGEPILDLMNSVPYDALCMGNREFHFLGIGVNSKTSRARFPVLSANIRPAKGGRSAHAVGPGFAIPDHARRASTSFNRDGVRIAVFGLTTPCVTERMLMKKISDYYFDQPILAAAEVVPKLRPECDILIALTHIGIKADRELASEVPGIDLILGGHTHVITEERVGETCIIHHGFYVHFVGKVDIEFDSGRVTGIKNELIPLAKA